MDMQETVKLSKIVKEFKPELYPFLKQRELNTPIVLRDGISRLNSEDAEEIIQYSIIHCQDEQFLH
ncbi:hypothetical protein [Marinicrinis sediminis]|uniref:Uncharacterized protein n=1 Tax=Marinicrinis sediminis TaxID=1652465 RepID=A0ABW5R955_9BACL